MKKKRKGGMTPGREPGRSSRPVLDKLLKDDKGKYYPTKSLFLF